MANILKNAEEVMHPIIDDAYWISNREKEKRKI